MASQTPPSHCRDCVICLVLCCLLMDDVLHVQRPVYVEGHQLHLWEKDTKHMHSFQLVYTEPVG